MKVRPAIRRWIHAQKLETTIRCLVTVWDVPLKIGRQTADSPEIRDRLAYLGGEREARTRRVIQVIDEVGRLAGAAGPHLGEPRPQEVSDERLSVRLQEALNEAQKTLSDASGVSKDNAAAMQAFQASIVAGGGMNAILSIASQSADNGASESDTAKRSQIDLTKGRILGLREGLAALQTLPPSVQRDEQMLSLIERSDGQLGTLRWIDGQLEMLQKNETYASFDSELSVLFWPDYPLDRWQPNVLHYRYDGSRERWLKTTLMVARLEAPTVALTTRLIDTAKKVEARGLQGNVYLDARGAAPSRENVTPGSYARYDLSIHELAADLKRHTALNVVLDAEGALFQSGDCPQAAIYCGWYSLGKYVDAFDWVAGSVGYHIASSEADTLRSPKSQVWCKRMLDEGVCATLGPVHEPYLTAFPLPRDFFILLLSGRYSLVEAYYRTKPFNSWVMTLIGDPLYNPFQNNPAFETKSIPAAWKRLFGDLSD